MFLPVVDSVMIYTITILYQLLVVAIIIISFCTITGNSGGSNSIVRIIPLLLLGS